MDILLLAPQPFFTERGTPIAVDLILRALSLRGERVDVVTFHLGQDVDYQGVTIYRTRKLPFIREVIPGFSWRKVLCDLLMVAKVLPMVLKQRYQLVHAVEESVYVALLLKVLFGIPYVYDMDSSLSQQMIDRYPYLFKPFAFLLRYFDRLAIRHAKAVVPVCDALSEEVQKYHPAKVTVLRDVSLLESTPDAENDDLRARLGIRGPMMMYVGNLESYQGIDLLLEGFALALKRKSNASLVIIGGKRPDIVFYQRKARELGIQHRVHFLGAKPIKRLAGYLGQADILVSPRVRGVNTPMKIYSYLDSGKALLATRLPTHTQVLNDEVAMLAAPSPRLFSHGVLRLMDDKKLRRKLGWAAKQLFREKHSPQVFNENLNALYDWLKVEIEQEETRRVKAHFWPLRDHFRQ